MRMSAREWVDDPPDDNARRSPVLADMLGPRVSDLDRLVIARPLIDQDANPCLRMRIGPLGFEEDDSSFKALHQQAPSRRRLSVVAR